MSKDQFYQQTFPFNQPSGTVSNFNYPNLTATTTATQQEESDVTKVSWWFFSHFIISKPNANPSQVFIDIRTS